MDHGAMMQRYFHRMRVRGELVAVLVWILLAAVVGAAVVFVLR